MCKVPRKIILPLHPNFALSMYEEELYRDIDALEQD